MKINLNHSSMDTARALILHLIELMNAEPERTFNIAFSGGDTPALMYDMWANDYRTVTPWERMRVYFVDERCVPVENSESNYGVLRLLLLGPSPISYDNVFAIRGICPPEEEARRYSRLVRDHLPDKGGWPVFDILLLGAGEDGHTSSIFPGNEKLLFSDKVYEATFSPYNGQPRIALTGRPLMAARKVIFLITGQRKAVVVQEICESGDISPAAYIARRAKDVELFIDSNAASLLTRVADPATER
ncbi:MAG: 6-phosphogluconolactonase [Bacteroides sp.]